MSLEEKLAEIRTAAAARFRAPTREIMHRATQDLRESGAPGRVIAVGAEFPAFELPNQRGEIVATAVRNGMMLKRP